MKKFLKEIYQKINLRFYGGVSAFVGALYYFSEIQSKYNFIISLSFALIIFVLFVLFHYNEMKRAERIRNYYDSKYKNDKDWKLYKKLKNKFKNN